MSAAEYFGLLGAIYLAPRVSAKAGLFLGVGCVVAQWAFIIMKAAGAKS